eukprot:scaffold5808_cov128-Isochrysis_galbana.AAC.15
MSASVISTYSSSPLGSGGRPSSQAMTEWGQCPGWTPGRPAAPVNGGRGWGWSGNRCTGCEPTGREARWGAGSATPQGSTPFLGKARQTCSAGGRLTPRHFERVEYADGVPVEEVTALRGKDDLRTGDRIGHELAAHKTCAAHMRVGETEWPGQYPRTPPSPPEAVGRRVPPPRWQERLSRGASVSGEGDARRPAQSDVGRRPRCDGCDARCGGRVQAASLKGETRPK